MLNKDILILNLREFIDKEYENFNGFPLTFEEAAEKWSNAFDLYAKTVIPYSNSSNQAKEAFKTTFISLKGSNINNFYNCFLNYVNVLAIGMNPTFNGIPPTSVLNLNSVFEAGLNGSLNSQKCINLAASILDIWMKTGTAVQNSTGVTVLWS